MAGRVDPPVAGEDRGAHLADVGHLVRLRAETGPISITWTAPLRPARFSNSSTDQLPVAYGPHLSVWRPAILLLHRGPKRVGRCCASVGVDRHFGGIFTEVVENGTGVYRSCRAWRDQPMGPVASGRREHHGANPRQTDRHFSGMCGQVAGRVAKPDRSDFQVLMGKRKWVQVECELSVAAGPLPAFTPRRVSVSIPCIDANR